MNHQAKRWCFTIHAPFYTAALLKKLQDQVGQGRPIEKLIHQEEKAPSTGILHIQGFLSVFQKKRLNQIKELIGAPQVHIEAAKGDDAAQETYCSKPETATGQHVFTTNNFGKRGVQGKRSDLDAIADRLKEGASMEDLTEDFLVPLIRYGKGIQFAQQLLRGAQATAGRPVTTIVLWGPSGTGKSLWARAYAQHFGLRLYSKPITLKSSTQWFDGYDGDDVLVLDDFDAGQVDFRTLLTWLDPYKLRVQLKGTMALARWSTVIITSNTEPCDWYFPMSSIAQEPLSRRLKNVHRTTTGQYAVNTYPITTIFTALKPDGLLPAPGSPPDSPQGRAPGARDGLDQAPPARPPSPPRHRHRLVFDEFDHDVFANAGGNHNGGANGAGAAGAGPQANEASPHGQADDAHLRRMGLGAGDIHVAPPQAQLQQGNDDDEPHELGEEEIAALNGEVIIQDNDGFDHYSADDGIRTPAEIRRGLMQALSPRVILPWQNFDDQY